MGYKFLFAFISIIVVVVAEFLAGTIGIKWLFMYMFTFQVLKIRYIKFFS